jgi:signal transduction histidine kinase
MEERVKRLGGTLRVESQRGKGATVTADLPIPAEGNA